MNAVATFTNESTAMQSNVFPNTSKAGHFNVCLKDMDSGETLPHVTIYPSLEAAVAAAKALV